MPTIDRQGAGTVWERRNLQLTISFRRLCAYSLPAGWPLFMYPLVFVHPEEKQGRRLRVAFFGFCALIRLLFVGYLFDRQRTFTKA